jgi:hypothetical protein
MANGCRGFSLAGQRVVSRRRRRLHQDPVLAQSLAQPIGKMGIFLGVTEERKLGHNFTLPELSAETSSLALQHFSSSAPQHFCRQLTADELTSSGGV